MLVVGFTDFGGPEVLGLIELPRPEPSEGEVRIQVRAATVNPTDLLMRSGVPYHRKAFQAQGVRPPYVPGMELAGVVDRVGPGVRRFRPGDRVAAIVRPTSRHGAQAEYVTVPERSIAPIPPGMGFADAATIPMNGLTAALAIDRLELEPGDTIVVTGAAGAVGGYAVQLAAHAGVHVIAIAGAGDETLVRDLGAAAFVPRGDEAVAAIRRLEPDGVTGVVDAALLGRAIVPAVRPGGRIALLRPDPGIEDPDGKHGVRLFSVVVSEYLTRDDKLRHLFDLAAQGKLRTRVARVLPAHEAAEAHRLLERGSLRGRLVLEFPARRDPA